MTQPSHTAFEIPAVTRAVEVTERGKLKDPAAFIDTKLKDSHAMLEDDVMSIPRDADVAYGQSNLCFRDVTFSIKSSMDGSEKVILTATSGAYEAGSMVAIMAGSMEGTGEGG